MSYNELQQKEYQLYTQVCAPCINLKVRSQQSNRHFFCLTEKFIYNIYILIKGV